MGFSSFIVFNVTQKARFLSHTDITDDTDFFSLRHTTLQADGASNSGQDGGDELKDSFKIFPIHSC